MGALIVADRPPHPLSDEHRLEEFRCTSPELTRWLIERALKNQHEGASRCFVVCDERRRVFGYYALAAGSVSAEDAPGRVRRNMPDPIPVAVLGRQFKLMAHRDRVSRTDLRAHPAEHTPTHE